MSVFASINHQKAAQASGDSPQKLIMEDLDFTGNVQKVAQADVNSPQKLIAEDLDFTKPSQSAIYDPATALAFFKSAGTGESVAPGETFFVEQQKSDSLFHKGAKMYLLVEGEVKLVIGKKAIDILKPGEIFGEMALISGMRRSATAVATTACRVLSMKMGQFQQALSRTPEFALMLMSIMINRLRLTTARLGIKHALPAASERHEGRVFEEAILAGLLSEARSIAQTRLAPGNPIMTAGETGHCMYVVLEGRVAVSVQGKVVERVGPGGVIGEMALIDHSPRAASAVAETSCMLLPISRSDFLALIKNNPAFGVALLKTLADRLRFMTSHISSN
jgi:CRP-like cAMP-binding protein